MTTNTKQQNIPRGWVIKNLSDLGEFKTGGVDKKIARDEKPVRLVNYMDVYKHGFIDDSINFMEVTASDSEIKVAQVRVGDMLFTPSSETPDDIGHSAVVAKDLPNTLFSYHLARLRFNEEYDNKIDINFRAYFCNARDVLRQFEKASVGATRYTISKGKFESIQVLIPESKKEQQKIAEILGTVDKDIAKTQEVIEATDKLKRGLMKDLFTSGTGKTKFVFRNLEELATISTGTTPSTGKKEYYEGNNPFIKTGEIVNKKIERAEVHISDKAVQDYRLKRYQPGTILVAMYGQGKTRGQTALLKIEACTTQNAAAIEPNTEIDSEYLWLFLKSQYELLRSGGIQGHISHLNLSYMKSYKVPVPSIQEQKKIASILSSIEERIATNQELKSKLSLLKKGLMQDLLTGKKRTI
ncbi:MAG: restriction endonuclease subunit S [bacterium]